ncbi:MAG: hypothetical protein A2096_12255 [Spirochaetes bacterium GWF1_41_5]|nr:MAG: hypothetical protein A2096_12255 [Spirochaetes bacterium GWF1_41_5]HBE03967.1 hypothetical protein [Spirochaetia bacterium]
MKNIPVISFCNHKGGVGKTTSALNISRVFASRGRKVLLIDFDPNAHASLFFGAGGSKYDSGHFMQGKNHTACRIKIMENLDLIPAGRELFQAEKIFPGISGCIKPINRVREYGQYDYIIIDTPSTAGIIINTAIAVSDLIIIPSLPDFLSLQGVNLLLGAVQEIEKKLKKNSVYAILFVMTGKQDSQEEDVLRWASEKLASVKFRQNISNDPECRAAWAAGKTIFDFSAAAAGREYSVLAGEIAERTGQAL